MLKELIHKYCNTSFIHKIYFHKEDGEKINQRFTFSSAKGYLDEYLGFYKSLDDFDDVIRLSCLGIFEFNYGGEIYRVRHPHQHHYKNFNGEERGVELIKLHEMSTKLLKCSYSISQSRVFEDIFEIVKHEKINGFGPLAVYDTSVRIGMSMNIRPSNVYLHAGAQKGMANLEEKTFVSLGTSEMDSVSLEILPEELRTLHPIQIENFLCLYKDDFKLL
ncbi:hypothetical protein [Aeromonas caviae]|uniref:hypothetical protein n=1 Tax=Aeromonas caviae TaxID=648 RepID=UPI0029D78B23|nr:hypothetical protein [Aeromonas caviae]MDX7785023.1 hypothetical protein [Aeromonas caviae]